MGFQRLLCWLPVVFAGCTIIYNPDNLPAPIDAIVPIDAPFDSNPDQLDITGVTPAAVDEGVGSGGGRPAILVLDGVAIIGAAQVTIDLMGSALPATLVAFDATADGTQAGLAVRIPVMTDLAAGAPRTLRITITQGTVTKMADVTVNGLDELTLTTSPRATTASPPTYSQITVASDIHFTGTEPVILRATADITFSRRIDADAAGRIGGPHGCDGGPMEMAGACSPGGGGPGTNAAVLGLGDGSGGGGGGFGGPGTIGSGTMAGSPGPASGSETLVPIRSDTGMTGNRGNGGGGGGGATLAMGGAGGGGGGVVFVEAGGTITVAAMGEVRSQGATSSGGSGGGGGGAGGAILIRSGAEIVSTTPWLSAPRGGASTGSNNAGGPGSPGRIRIDTPVGDVPSMASNPSGFRGPSWAPATPSLTTTSPLTIQLRGQPGRSFPVRVNDAAVGDFTPGVGGTIDIPNVTLRPGKNTICAVALAGVLLPESLGCVELFYAGT